MGNAWSITYQLKDVVRLASVNTTVNVSEAGSGSKEEIQTHDVTLYYCGLWTWRDRPCETLVDDLWVVIIGASALVLLVLLSMWACLPQDGRVGATKYSALAPAAQPLYVYNQQRRQPTYPTHTHRPPPPPPPLPPPPPPLRRYPNAYTHHPEAHAHIYASQAVQCEASSLPSAALSHLVSTQPVAVRASHLDSADVAIALAPNASAGPSEGSNSTLRCSLANLVSRA